MVNFVSILHDHLGVKLTQKIIAENNRVQLFYLILFYLKTIKSTSCINKCENNFCLPRVGNVGHHVTQSAGQVINNWFVLN
jgi:hypothetical protein